MKEFLRRIVDWENEFYAFRLQRVEPQETVKLESSKFTEESVASYLRNRFPDRRDFKVSRLQTLSGGFSKTTVMFDVEDAVNGTQSLVIRAEPPMRLVFLDGGTVHNEYHVLKLAHQAGLRVAEPLWLDEDVNLFGGALLVSRKAPGKNIGSRVSVDEAISQPLLHDFIDNLVRIHHTPIDRADPNVRNSHLRRWSQFATLTECVAEEVAFWRQQVARMDLPPSPLLARALQWLEDNVPECDEAPSLLHGDYALHNILVQDDRVACILDWECATIGDPAEDLGWLMDGLRGHVDRQDVLDLYRTCGGRSITEFRLRFFDVLTAVKFAVTPAWALKLFESHPTADLAACQLGLLFTHHGTGQLNHFIEMAEQARDALHK